MRPTICLCCRSASKRVPRWRPTLPGTAILLRGFPSRLRFRWVFPNANGTGPIDPKNWYRRTFKAAVRKAATSKSDPILDFRFHDLRHTTASRLRHLGVPIEDVAEALGHSDTRVTQRYAHIAPGRMDAVMELLASRATCPAGPSGDSSESTTDPRTDPSADQANTARDERSATA